MRELDGSGWAALHFAIVYGAPAELVGRLLLSWPAGARHRAGEGSFGRLPLQLAASRAAPHEVGLEQFSAG